MDFSRCSRGQTTSIVLLAADPLEDIRNVRRIEGVFLRGRYFDHVALADMFEEVRRAVAAGKATAPD